jgi:hypothetical protein
MTGDEFDKSRFSSLNEPAYWFSTAWSFRHAARAIFATLSEHELSENRLALPPGMKTLTPVHGRTNVYVFLEALALENLLKAEYMRQHPNAIRKSEGVLPGELRVHDLSKLALLVGFSVSPEEALLLKRASDSIISWGRYPGGPRYNKGDIAPPDDLGPKSFKTVCDPLFDRLDGIISPSLEAAGWFEP